MNLDTDRNIYVPVADKIALTIPEAAALSNIGQNKISKLLRLPNCPFVVYVGAKRLVKRREFERYISDHLEV